MDKKDNRRSPIRYIREESVTKRMRLMDTSKVEDEDTADGDLLTGYDVFDLKINSSENVDEKIASPPRDENINYHENALDPDEERSNNDRRPSWVLEEEERLCTFDEQNSLSDSLTINRRSRLFRRISEQILSGDTLDFDTVDGRCSNEDENADDNTCTNVLNYLQTVTDDTRTEVAKYLSSGNLEQIHLSLNNIHNIYHIASSLNLQQLCDMCMQFCSVNNQDEVISHFKECKCKKEIETASKAGYQRSHSIISNPDDDSPPEFYIVFSKDVATTSKCNKIGVIVIDTSEKMDIFNREMEKRQYFDKGFSCCSCERNDSPYVYVSGGEGKNSKLVLKYDVLLNRWVKCTRLLHGRSKHAMVTAKNGSIYVIGGKEVPCIEEYNHKTRKWTEHGSLKTHVFSAVVVVFQHKIFIFGGKTPAGPVASVQCFDTLSNEMNKLDDLPCQFFGGHAVVLNEKIYIATGQGHMICFDPRSGASHLCSQQPVKRKHFGMFVKNERIYLVGGVLNDEDDEECVSETPQYRYNTEKDSWVEKYKLCKCFPVYASCIIKYPKKCAVIPFNDKF